jgi:hypothetical protein
MEQEGIQSIILYWLAALFWWMRQNFHWRSGAQMMEYLANENVGIHDDVKRDSHPPSGEKEVHQLLL